METYTVDANAVLVYLVDALPTGADRLFGRAETGEVRLELPTIAAIETVYQAQKGVTVRGQRLAADAADVVDALDRQLPLTVVADDETLLREVVSLLDPFPRQIHDATIVASHRARDTDAIVTADERMADVARTVWD
jgi:predicted nucleic acid-binding protein